MLDVDLLAAQVSTGQWIPVIALIIGLIVRVLKDDTKLPTVPTKYRRPMAFGLGLVAAMLQMIALGATWKDAALTAIVAPLLAIGGHHLGIDVVRKGREIPVPGLMKPPGAPPPETEKTPTS